MSNALIPTQVGAKGDYQVLIWINAAAPLGRAFIYTGLSVWHPIAGMQMAASKWLLVSGVVLLSQTTVWAQDHDSDLGKIEYQSKCASCHGNDAKGDGPIADQLKIPPANLTQLAKKNGGVFPLSAVYEKIDGRQEVKAHGPRDMPVWGYRYLPSPNPTPSTTPIQSWSWLDVPDPEAVVRERILALVDYLYRIQEK